ncbi:hypothetical protein TcasGA2_TC004646 [Tribolium castaneum]|uniref:Uncharacterized protein n=1 Tax=Tribolium castaneum TaxID=7070 RepID=D6W7B5_TRICA|nr:PREDICTED: uncharacterized protein LOC660215 [Tribolium castaneum]EFA11052.1 hypothetical protein TcasGA2_TC004646 [Tribolium castaneum]|eukprot:XP_971559.1 PREDICTED: uncharacterized protein LOC660215 [Tribolium castaneum]
MKFFVVFALFIAATVAQRPTYAGSRPIGRPDLASRFKDPEEQSTVAVYNRVGEDGTTARIPVDARGDGQLVDRLNQWPREHRPFWLLNADHIEASRNGQNVETRSGFDINSEGARPIRPTEQRSSFLGPLNSTSK